ncbi:hypothetical protein BC831DRAFT_429030 [Entophlyctis helioformis]|nr:hypothetical protein BC831DRAFT_429030 [Entophlyctis helioformis]
MVAARQLVLFSPAQTLEVAKLIAQVKDDSSVLETAEALVEQGNSADLAALFAAESAALLSLPEKDLESIFNLVIGLVRAVPAESLPTVVQSITDAFVAGGSDHVIAKLRILSTLYNSIDTYDHARFTVYTTIVKVAAAGGQVETIASTLPQLESWTAEWGLSVAERRALFLLVSQELAKAPAYLLTSHEFLLKHLNTYQGLSKEAGAEGVKKHATKALVQAISIPEVLVFDDVLRLTAVQALGANKLVDLAKIFLDQSLAQYKAFVAKNPKFVKEQGLSEESNVRKMRILTFASLAAQHIQSEIPYDAIASALSISEDEVEIWAIDVIRTGLVDAKINQLERTLAITRSTQRVFGQEQWEQLRERLAGWRSSVAECVRVLDAARPLPLPLRLHLRLRSKPSLPPAP